jgi:hypothetical protein
MTLFPSALRSDRLRAMGAPPRPAHGFRNLVTWVARRRLFSSPTLSVVAPHADATPHERPEPQLIWTDPRTPPGGDFSACSVPNVELAATEIPRRVDSWDTVSDFALSYDGYEYWDDLPELARRVLQRWTRSRTLPDTLDELRGCLFYEQRRWHHFGEDPSGRSAEYMRAVIDAIRALAVPVTPSTGRIADPRAATAMEAHVKLVSTNAVALGPVARRVDRLVPVAAAEAHVRLVSSIEAQAVKSRHPSASMSRRSAGHPSEHTTTNGVIRELRPMPSPEPLPKPPVIVRRSRPDVPLAPNRPGGAVNASRPSAQGRNSTESSREKRESSTEKTESQPTNGARRDDALDTPNSQATEVTPLCREFSNDDAGYLAWVKAHPAGFVLNQPRAARAKTPTLHRVGCAVVSGRGDTVGTLTVTAVKVCGPSAEVLGAWSAARGAGPPTACRRCCQ